MFVNCFIPTRRYNYIPYLGTLVLRCVAFHSFSFFFFDYMYISTYVRYSILPIQYLR